MGSAIEGHLRKTARPAIVTRAIVAHPHVELLPLGWVVNGSKVVVRRLWCWHRGGTSVETLMRRYPNLGPAKVLDALAFAYDNREAIEAELEGDRATFFRSRAEGREGAVDGELAGEAQAGIDGHAGISTTGATSCVTK
jgi:uncharacterized protein (DUF433 family)